MAEIIVVTDLPANVRESVESADLDLMVAGANAKASRVAPCLSSIDPEPSEDQLAEARLVLVGAVKRWVEAGSGGATTEQLGPWSHTFDTRQRGGYNLWPSEIEQLQDVCAGGKKGGAFSFSLSGSYSPHLPWCSLTFGALDCSCGADLTGYEYPLYEGGVLSGDEY